MACPVTGIAIRPSPAWLVDILALHGMKTINNVVDVTNYVTLETGQPLHAFDMDKVEGKSLIVRQARENEMIETLDGKKIALNPSALVIADEQDALDIAGVKGGTKAEIGNGTVNIILTAANFDGAITYKTARRVGIATDASLRFSHHLSPELTERGLYRALELLEELVGGTIGKITDAYPKPEHPAPIKFGAKEFERIIGQKISEAECARTMKKLGCKVAGTAVTPPRWRTDIRSAKDCAEEVVRSIGHGNIAPIAPNMTPGTAGTEESITFIDMMSDTACSMGYTEIRTGSCAEEGNVQLENPVNKELPFLRPSLLPNMKTMVRKNLRNGGTTAIFEIGRVFGKKVTHEATEETRIALGTGTKGESAEMAFRKVRGAMEAMLHAANIGTWTTEEAGGELIVLHNGENIGTCSYDADLCAGLAELSIDKLIALKKPGRAFKPLPKFPASFRDISLIVAEREKIGKIMDAFRSHLPKHGKELSLVSIYKGKEVDRDRKSATFRILFEADDRTLEDAEIDREMDALIEAMRSAIVFEIG